MSSGTKGQMINGFINRTALTPHFSQLGDSRLPGTLEKSNYGWEYQQTSGKISGALLSIGDWTQPSNQASTGNETIRDYDLSAGLQRFLYYSNVEYVIEKDDLHTYICIACALVPHIKATNDPSHPYCCTPVSTIQHHSIVLI